MTLSLLLHDPRLLFIVVLSGAVSMLTTLNVAARPAAVQTGRVALAFTISSLFFMCTRFANLFYAPLLGRYVGLAVKQKDIDPTALSTLYAQIQWIVVGAAIGAFMAWMLLPTFVQLYKNGIASMEYRHSMLAVLLRLTRPSGIRTLFRSFRPPSLLGVRLFKLDGVPVDFLIVNAVATAIWTVGFLCAIMASALNTEYQQTSLLLSGLVNAFAAIAFSVWVDPKAALITDQAIHGERPEAHVRITAVHLSAGNFVGACLGLAVLWPGTCLILDAASRIGKGSNALSLSTVVMLNVFVTLLASTTVASRVSAVVTKRVATALAVYNLFFLATRLATQIYAPFVASLADNVRRQHLPVESLLPSFRWIVAGASIGSAAAFLLLPTFVEIYNAAIGALERLGSIPRLFGALLTPRAWFAVLRCLRPPSLVGVRLADLNQIPRAFVYGNLFVVSVYTIGLMAAIYAGACLSAGSAEEQELARAATLLSSVVNGVATIMVSVIVDPTSAFITDQCVKGDRPERHIYIMAVFLLASTLAGTVLSQAFFLPATSVIIGGARILKLVF